MGEKVGQQIHIGTSGWNYKHWKTVFYPDALKSKDWLSYYTQHFPTVELNVTFYRGVKATTFEKWYQTAPPAFLFSVKMSRYITHIKRLRIERESIDRFSSNVSILKEKLGVVLIQLPPSLKFDPPLLSDFFGLLDPGFRYTVEARNDTFVSDEFFSLLKERNIAWCVADAGGRQPYHETATADFIYMRFHGRGSGPASNYRDDELAEVREKILRWRKETFVYFNNDISGYAVKNALTLQHMLETG